MIRRLLDRRVPQFVALYVAGGWGFVQFVDWAVDEYLLAPALTTFVAVLLLLFIPHGPKPMPTTPFSGKRASCGEACVAEATPEGSGGLRPGAGAFSPTSPRRRFS